MNVRIEICLSEEEAAKLNLMAKHENRSRKNFCEMAMRNVIELSSYLNPGNIFPPLLQKQIFGRASDTTEKSSQT